jgi:glucosamine--fructose-6-phosphate aminotransferase (isomerizing)
VSDPSPAAETVPGKRFFAEIYEQPLVLARLASSGAAFTAVADEIRGRGIRAIRMVGHGSSDNAASYGVYAFGLLAGLTAFRDSISLSVYFDADIDVSDSCVLALSQSGRTPDVVDYLERARRRGALTVAMTNDASSPLAEVTDVVLPLLAREEQAVAATKTYTAQVSALMLLAAHVGGRGEEHCEVLDETSELLREWLPRAEVEARSFAGHLEKVQRMLVVGRGAEFATAREIALKLLETCRMGADAMTATDLAHGPVAALDESFPVWAVAADDASLPMVIEAVARARRAHAPVLASGTAAVTLDGVAVAFEVPRAASPLHAPILSVVPGQLVAGALALARGLDPDHPDGLEKVTDVQ